MAQRRLITGKLNPYQNTIDRAMQSLASLEESIRKSTLENLRSSAREMRAKRFVLRQGYLAGTNPAVGWMYQNSTDRDYLLKRLNIVFPTAATIAIEWVLQIGGENAAHVREVGSVETPPDATTAKLYTFGDGSVGQIYSDSFDNDVYLRAGESMYINVSSGADTTMIVSIEIEQLVPYNYAMTETERLSRAVAPKVNQDVANIAEVAVTVDPDEAERHVGDPDVLEDMQDSNLYVEGSQLSDDDGRLLIPDAEAHLPDHLKGL
jgi:hypothetical protein